MYFHPTIVYHIWRPLVREKSIFREGACCPISRPKSEFSPRCQSAVVHYLAKIGELWLARRVLSEVWTRIFSWHKKVRPGRLHNQPLPFVSHLTTENKWPLSTDFSLFSPSHFCKFSKRLLSPIHYMWPNNQTLTRSKVWFRFDQFLQFFGDFL